MDIIRVNTIRLTLGEDKKGTFEVREGDVVTIGRDPSCTIQIAHESVSPVHCRIEFKNGSFFLTDLDSAAGVIESGRKHKHLQLAGDQNIQIGAIPVISSEGRSDVSSSELALGPIASPILRLGTFARRPAKAAAPPARIGLLSAAVALFRRAPAFSLSAVLHIVILALVYDVPYLRFADYETEKILVEVDDVTDLALLDEDKEEDKIEFDEPPLFPDDIPDYLNEEELDEDPVPEADDDGLRLDPGTIGTGGGSDRGWALGLRGDPLRNISAGARNYIEGLRRTGVDVAFVMDTTSSMERFINEAKVTVDRLITGLVHVVPDLRLSIVAYRDQKDEYLTHAVEFSKDRFELLNFLESLEAKGGGDREEAVFEGLNRAIRHLFWRPGAQKVVLLIGDSGYHREDERKLFKLLAEFRRQGGIVHAVCLGDEDTPTFTEKSVVEMYSRLSQATGGNCVQFSDYDKLFNIFVTLAFTSEFEPDVASIAAKAERSRIAQSILRRSKKGDRPWLLEKLTRTPVHPCLVQELLKGTTRQDLTVLVDYLASETVSSRTKWAALYIIHRTLGKDYGFDPKSAVSDQAGKLQMMRRAAELYPVGDTSGSRLAKPGSDDDQSKLPGTRHPDKHASTIGK